MGHELWDYGVCAGLYHCDCHCIWQHGKREDDRGKDSETLLPSRVLGQNSGPEYFTHPRPCFKIQSFSDFTSDPLVCDGHVRGM